MYGAILNSEQMHVNAFGDVGRHCVGVGVKATIEPIFMKKASLGV